MKDRLENFLSPAEERLGGITKGALTVMHKQVATAQWARPTRKGLLVWPRETNSPMAGCKGDKRASPNYFPVTLTPAHHNGTHFYHQANCPSQITVAFGLPFHWCLPYYRSMNILSYRIIMNKSA